MDLTDKFIILKRADVVAVASRQEMDVLQSLFSKIVRYRAAQGKRAMNSYMVINQDEPYYPDVLKLMEAHS